MTEGDNALVQNFCYTKLTSSPCYLVAVAILTSVEMKIKDAKMFLSVKGRLFVC